MDFNGQGQNADFLDVELKVQNMEPVSAGDTNFDGILSINGVAVVPGAFPQPYPGNLDVTENVNAAAFVSTGGTSSQFVKGNGTLDSTTYVANPSYVNFEIIGADLITNSIKNDDDVFTMNLSTASIHNGTGYVLSVDSSIEAYTFNKIGGTGIQYLMADGSTLTQSATSGNSNFYLYDNTNSISDITPVAGEVIINSLTNTTATIVYISHTTRDNIDVEIFWKFVNTLTELYLQDQNLSTNYIQYNITGTPAITVGNKIAIPVSVVSSGGTGSTLFGEGHNILVSFFTNNLEVDTRLSGLEQKTSPITVSGSVFSVSTATSSFLNVTGSAFTKTGGLSSEFLKANGSVDSTAYLPLTGGTVTGALTSSGGLNTSGISIIDVQMGNVNSIFSGLEYNNGSATIATRSNSSWTALGSTSAVDFFRGPSNFRVFMPATALWSTSALADGAMCGYSSVGLSTTGALVFNSFPFGFMCNLSIQDTTYDANNCQNFWGVSNTNLNLNQTTQLSDARNFIGFGSATGDANICLYSASNSSTYKVVDLGASFPANRLNDGQIPKNWYRLAFWYNGLGTIYWKCNSSNQTAGSGTTVSGSASLLPRPASNAALFANIQRTMGTPNVSGQAKLAVQKAGVWY